MTKERLKILIEENRERMKVPLSRREIDIPTDLELIVSIVGVRRCGKTYLMFQTIQGLLANVTSEKDVLYINFEDERISGLKVEEYDLIIEAYNELRSNFEGQKYIFFDEIQNLENWEVFVNRLYSSGYKVFITGSSSKMLSTEIATTLRGRSMTFHISPFSFKEYLSFLEIDLEENFQFSSQRFEIKKAFEDYFKWGGIPALFKISEQFRYRYIQEYLDLILFKDVIERYKIRKPIFLKELTQYMLLSSSNFFSLNKTYKYFKSVMGFDISKDTTYDYYSKLIDVNIVNEAYIASKSYKKTTLNPRKIYAVDHVLYNSLTIEQEKGRTLENIVFNELKRKEFKVHYYKEANEVDFIAIKGNNNTPIQVSYSINEKSTRERELKGLLEYMDKYKVDKGIVITYDEREEIKTEKKVINVIPIWEWLLT